MRYKLVQFLTVLNSRCVKKEEWVLVVGFLVAILFAAVAICTFLRWLILRNISAGLVWFWVIAWFGVCLISYLLAVKFSTEDAGQSESSDTSTK